MPETAPSPSERPRQYQTSHDIVQPSPDGRRMTAWATNLPREAQAFEDRTCEGARRRAECAGTGLAALGN